jgi:large subunit ribosomal protein L6
MSETKVQVLRKPNSLDLQLLFPQKLLQIQGSFGKFYYPLSFDIEYAKTDKKLWLVDSNFRKKRALFFLNQVLLKQLCLGAIFGYRKQLKIVGIGYQAAVEKTETSSFLSLKLGYSHQLRLSIPSTLQIICPKPRVILIKGMNLQKVANYAAFIRRLRLPNSYKEKGIYHFGEKLKLKQGKKT